MQLRVWGRERVGMVKHRRTRLNTDDMVTRIQLPSVVGERRRKLISIVKRSKTHQSLLPFDIETKFLVYLNR
jgi:hypothetical protein